MEKQTPLDFRKECRDQNFKGTTTEQFKGYVKVNLVIIPKEFADDFKIFCERNPKCCPILEMTEPGDFSHSILCPEGVDLRTDFPKYRVFKKGEFQYEFWEIKDIWRADLVSFLIGSPLSFEETLEQEGYPARNRIKEKDPPMYITSQMCEQAGIFNGKLVVSMRPYKKDQIKRVYEISSEFPDIYGAPMYAGNEYESFFGIKNLQKPDYGDPIILEKDDIPVFWVTDVIPQYGMLRAKDIDLTITQAHGCMLVTDKLNEEFRVKK